MLSVVSFVALAIIAAALYLAWTKRVLVVGVLVMANLLVFALTLFGTTLQTDTGHSIPAIHWDLALHGDALAAGEPLAILQLLTSMFVHADGWHLLGNVIILLAFALPFEDRIGHRRFLGIYLGTGLAAALIQTATMWGTPSLLMGASGAVFGIIGAFAASYPNQIIAIPVPLPIMILIRMRVLYGAIMFGALQFLLVAISAPGDNTAYWAHVGGLIVGIGAGRLLAAEKVQQEPRGRVDLASLTLFADDDATQGALDQAVANSDVPQVRQAWIERFFRTARCPTCGDPVLPRREGVIVCARGHNFDLRRMPSGPPGPPGASGE